MPISGFQRFGQFCNRLRLISLRLVVTLESERHLASSLKLATDPPQEHPSSTNFRRLAVAALVARLSEMSRRSRRSKSAGENRWLGKLGIWLGICCLLTLTLIYGALRSYLHSDAFRKFLSAEASQAVNVTGEFARFRWDGLAVETDSFAARGGTGLITAVHADGLRTEIGLGAVRRGVWEIRDSSVRRLEISVDATAPLAPPLSPGVSPEHVAKSRPPAWIPRQAEIQQIDIRELTIRAILNQGLATLSGMNVHAEMAGAKDAYRTEIEGGSIHLPFPIAPELLLDRAQLRYQNQQIFLSHAKLRAWENGRIEATGEWDMKSQQFFADGDASGINCEEVLPIDWSKRLTGTLNSSFALHNRSGFPQASGKLVLQNSVLTALPILDALAAYADTRRFRILTLNDAHTDWSWQRGDLTLSHLVLFAEGLVRVEGGLVLHGQEIDGIFRLGLAPGTLATIPGAETDVFLPGERGLLWTTVRVTGTLDDPKEDLTERLITAAGLRMFDQIPETGEKVIKFTQSLLKNPSPDTLETSSKIIKEGKKAVRDVGGILSGILGGAVPPEPKDTDEIQ